MNAFEKNSSHQSKGKGGNEKHWVLALLSLFLILFSLNSFGEIRTGAPSVNTTCNGEICDGSNWINIPDSALVNATRYLQDASCDNNASCTITGDITGAIGYTSGSGGFYFAGGNLSLGDGNFFHVNDSNLFNVLDFTKSTIFNSAFDADFNQSNVTRLLQDSNCDNNSNCTISYSVLSNTPHIPNSVTIDANINEVLDAQVPWQDANVADDITLTNITQITNRSYSDLQDQPFIPSTTAWDNNFALRGAFDSNTVLDSRYVNESDLNNGTVSQIIAGTNITVSPTNGIGVVTINSTASGGSGGGFYYAGGNLTLGDGNIFHVNDSNIISANDLTTNAILYSATQNIVDGNFDHSGDWLGTWQSLNPSNFFTWIDGNKTIDTNAFTGCSATQVLVGATGCTNTPTLTGTNFTGVPASGITAGTFGSGAYTFPSTLQVNDAISIDGSPQLLLDISGTSTTELNVADSISGVTSRLGVTNTVGFLGTSTDNNFNILTNNTDRIKISNDGWIGFGTNPQPGVMLSIVDTATSSANLISLYSPNQWPGYIVSGGTAGTGVDGLRLQNDDDLSTNFGMTGSSHSTCASCGFIYNSEDGQFSVLFDNSTNSSDVIFPNGSLDIADEITVNSDLGNVDSNFGSDTKQNALSIDADRYTNGFIQSNVPHQHTSGFGLQSFNDKLETSLSGDDLTINNDTDIVYLHAQTGTADNLDTIIGGYDGQIIYIIPLFGHTITIRNGQAGSGVIIRTYNSLNYTIDVTNLAMLRRVGANWYLLSPSNGV